MHVRKSRGRRVTYELRWEDPVGVFVRYTGDVTPDGIASCSEQVTSDPRFDGLRYAIADFTGAPGHRFDLSNRNQLSMSCATLIGAAHSNRHIHAAFVIAGSGVEELLQKLLESGSFPYPACIFRSQAEARDWLASLSSSFRRPQF